MNRTTNGQVSQSRASRTDGIPLYVSPSVSHALEQLGVLLDDYGYSPRARDEVLAYTEQEGTPSCCPSLDAEDEADACEVYASEMEPVDFGDPRWGSTEDIDSVDVVPPVSGGSPEVTEFDPTAEDLADYHQWSEALDARREIEAAEDARNPLFGYE
jgi:hypothetical protein